MARKRDSEMLFKFFKVKGENRKFMYLFGSQNRKELEPFIDIVKGQGDLYRITHDRFGYIIWDARR